MHDFEVISQMITNDTGVKVSLNVIEAKQNKKSGKITFEVDSVTASQVMRGMFSSSGGHMAMLVVVDRDEFDKVKQNG